MVWVVPLLAMKLIPHCLTPEKHVHGIRSLSGVGTLVRALAQSVALPPLHFYSRLALKLFRGIRAISKFDWPFTPTLTSSKSFSTDTGSDLHVVLPTLHPGQG